MEISPALRRRLPAYFRTLIRMYGNGKERVSSEELACELSLVPSQVRTDMKAIGCQGQRSYGYVIAKVYKKIADIFQLSDKFRAVIVGSSHLAHAISESSVFLKRGIKLSAVMEDTETAPGNGEWKLLPECSVLPCDCFCDYFRRQMPDIVILAGETEKAKQIFDFLQSEADCSDGKAHFEVWNFTDNELTSDKINTKNIHMSDYLMLLCLDAGR